MCSSDLDEKKQKTGEIEIIGSQLRSIKERYLKLKKKKGADRSELSRISRKISELEKQLRKKT